MNAQAFLTSLTNTLKKGITYRGSFRLRNYTNNGNDLTFFYGQNNKENSSEEDLMNIFYSKMIHDFVKNGVPNKCKPIKY